MSQRNTDYSLSLFRGYDMWEAGVQASPKRSRVVALCALLIASVCHSHALASVPVYNEKEAKFSLTAEHLAYLCSQSANDLCKAYTQGVADGLVVNGKICPVGAPTMDPMVSVFLGYFSRNGVRASENGYLVIRDALVAAFPCQAAIKSGTRK